MERRPLIRYLLDTDTCIEILRGRGPHRARLEGCSPEEVGLPAMVVAELRYGALGSREPERGLALVGALLEAPLTILPFDGSAASVHADLRDHLRATAIGERDLVIAAIARAGDFTLVTGNGRHFRRVPGLEVEDWGPG